jgi:hypothetical protein
MPTAATRSLNPRLSQYLAKAGINTAELKNVLRYTRVLNMFNLATPAALRVLNREDALLKALGNRFKKSRELTPSLVKALKEKNLIIHAIYNQSGDTLLFYGIHRKSVPETILYNRIKKNFMESPTMKDVRLIFNALDIKFACQGSLANYQAKALIEILKRTGGSPSGFKGGRVRISETGGKISTTNEEGVLTITIPRLWLNKPEPGSLTETPAKIDLKKFPRTSRMLQLTSPYALWRLVTEPGLLETLEENFRVSRKIPMSMFKTFEAVGLRIFREYDDYRNVSIYYGIHGDQIDEYVAFADVIRNFEANPTLEYVAHLFEAYGIKFRSEVKLGHKLTKNLLVKFHPWNLKILWDLKVKEVVIGAEEPENFVEQLSKRKEDGFKIILPQSAFYFRSPKINQSAIDILFIHVTDILMELQPDHELDPIGKVPDQWLLPSEGESLLNFSI